MTTWPHIVGFAAHPGDTRYELRACVYCGALSGADMKTISMDEPPHDTPFQDTVAVIFDNLCSATRQYADSSEDAALFSCLNCFNCLTRRSPQAPSLHPLSALWWEITTKRRWTHKAMDARVVRRLCLSLVETPAEPAAEPPEPSGQPEPPEPSGQPGQPEPPEPPGQPEPPEPPAQPAGTVLLANYYYRSGIFSPAQQALIARIAAHAIADVPALIAEHIHADNRNTIFLQTAPLAEFIRQHASHAGPGRQALC
jgi:hypothetical protein